MSSLRTLRKNTLNISSEFLYFIPYSSVNTQRRLNGICCLHLHTSCKSQDENRKNRRMVARIIYYSLLNSPRGFFCYPADYCSRFLWNINMYFVNETNRCTEFQFYWYYYSTCFGQPFCPSSGVLSRTSPLVHLMQLWWTVCYQE